MIFAHCLFLLYSPVFNFEQTEIWNFISYALAAFWYLYRWKAFEGETASDSKIVSEKWFAVNRRRLEGQERIRQFLLKRREHLFPPNWTLAASRCLIYIYVPPSRKLVFSLLLRVAQCCVLRYRGMKCTN